MAQRRKPEFYDPSLRRVYIPRALPGDETDHGIVGMDFDFQYLQSDIDRFVERYMPTADRYTVVNVGGQLLMRYELEGFHPLRPTDRISVVGIGDRHYRAVNAAEQAWAKYHENVFLRELAAEAR